MENLNEKQIKEVKALIRLGDSVEIAIKTVLNKKDVNVELYKKAYEL